MSDESQSKLLERLAAHRVAGAIPRREMEWIATNGTLRVLQPGDVLTSRSAGIVEGLFIVLSGHLALRVQRANGLEKIMDWRAGDVAGMLPYSRLTVPPGDSTAEEPTEIIVVRRELMETLTRECHAFTSALVHIMVDRARHFTTSALQAEKMASLGKLCAGMAHELNNPAAAIARSAGSLHDAIAMSESASRALGALNLTAEQRAALDALHAEATRPPVPHFRTALEQSDREAELEEWLDAHGADPSNAGSLVDTCLTIEMLDEMAESLPREALRIGMQWIAAGAFARELAHEIRQASGRVSTLIDAVKGFTQMDLSTSAGPVDVGLGVRQTVTIHNAKAREKSVSLTAHVEKQLPPTHGVAGELNQVWANLIDNAIDAAGPSGRVAVTAALEGQTIFVRVIDDGPGVPEDIRGRIFDPFFTTKKLGQGTGLGLDVVRRVVQKHGGSVTLESEPGRTTFAVSLPAAGGIANSASATAHP